MQAHATGRLRQVGIWTVCVSLILAVASLAVAATVPLAAKVAPQLRDMPASGGWQVGPSSAFKPRNPPVLFCRGRAPGLENLAATQVVFRDFLTPQLDGLTAATIAFETVDAAHSWYTRELRPGFASCVIRGQQEDAAVMGAAQGVHASSRLIRSAVHRLQVGTEAYELSATFRLSAGGTEKDIWALAHFGRVVFVLHSFSFSGKTPFSPALLLVKVIKRTPAR